METEKGGPQSKRPLASCIVSVLAFLAALIGLAAAVTSYMTAREARNQAQEVGERLTTTNEKVQSLTQRVEVLQREAPQVSFSLMYPQDKDEVGDGVRVSGVATPGTNYRYVFIGVKGDGPPNHSWWIGEMVQVRISGGWSGRVDLSRFPIDRDRDIHIKAVLSSKVKSYPPFSFEQVFPREGDNACVESEEVIIRRIR